jgi:hypothetical protein
MVAGLAVEPPVHSGSGEREWTECQPGFRAVPSNEVFYSEGSGAFRGNRTQALQN